MARTPLNCFGNVVLIYSCLQDEPWSAYNIPPDVEAVERGGGRNIECIYSIDMNFVLVDPSGRRSSKVIDGPLNLPSSRSRARAASSSLKSNSPDHSDRANDIYHLPQSCVASSCHAQAHGSLLERYAPMLADGTQKVGTGNRPPIGPSWLYTAHRYAHTDSLLSDSLAALSLAYHERQNGISNYALGSRVMYGKAMKILSRRLGTRNHALEDSTLAAALLLALFETQSANTRLVDRYQHAKGISTIISIRGRGNIETEFGRQLYLGSRLLYLIAVMDRRKALDPAELKYHTFFSGAYFSYVHLFDILQAFPEVIELGDRLEYAVTTGAELELQDAFSAFKFASEEFRSQLSKWREKLGLQEDETDENPLSWDVPSLLYDNLPATSPARIHKNGLCFRSPDIAQQLIISWTCLLLVEGWLPVMQRKIIEYGRSTVSLFQTGAEKDRLFVRCNARATDIFKSLEYFVHPNMGLAISEIIGLPLTIAMGWWKLNRIDAREMMWIPVILTRMRQTNIGYSDLVRRIAIKGGGGVALRILIEQDQSPSPW